MNLRYNNPTDNYQGEESNIVIVSFVRSNASGDIGFMSSPERLNVLLSRARNTLIMIGNPDTFIRSRAGRPLYSRFFSFLKEDGHVYEGLPIQCPRHPNIRADLATPAHFEQNAPNRSCTKPWYAIQYTHRTAPLIEKCSKMLLECGLHMCPSKCHHCDDHSKIVCRQAMGEGWRGD